MFSFIKVLYLMKLLLKPLPNFIKPYILQHCANCYTSLFMAKNT